MIEKFQLRLIKKTLQEFMNPASSNAVDTEIEQNMEVS